MVHPHRTIRVCFCTLILAVLLTAACSGAVADETWTLVELLTQRERIYPRTELIEVRNCGVAERKTVDCSAGTSNDLSISLSGGVGAIDAGVRSSLGLGRDSGESLDLDSPPEGFVYRYTVNKEFRVMAGEVLARSSAGNELRPTYAFHASCSLRIESQETLTCAEAEKPAPTPPSPPPPPTVLTIERVSVTLSPVLERRFIVVYPRQDGLSLRIGPSRSYAEVTILPVGTELVLNGSPVRGTDSLKWWPVSSPYYGEGWVAEWIQIGQHKWRLIKPKIAPDEVVEVANPLGEGNVNLRNQSCEEIDTLSRGTKLRIVSGPESKCDTPDSPIVWEGREWWYVMTPHGTQGWIADFSEGEKAILIAPQWYVELSSFVPSP